MSYKAKGLSGVLPSEDRRSATTGSERIAWHLSASDQNVFAGAWAVQDRFGLSWWDGLIVAAARVADCAYLLPKDLQHDQDLDGLRVINPFKIAPDDR